jgi:hypothetical protein
MRHVLDAFAAETERLATVMLTVTPEEFARPSPCPPWTVAGLFGHVATAVGRLREVLAAPAPLRAEVSAAGYYRADERFSAQTNEDRIAVGIERAGAVDGHALAVAFDADWREIVALCRWEEAGQGEADGRVTDRQEADRQEADRQEADRQEADRQEADREEADREKAGGKVAGLGEVGWQGSGGREAGRVVRTRHGDAMLLSEFLVTRVVEVSVHGLDLADGLGRGAWLTPAAGEVLTSLFFGGDDSGPVVDADLLRGLTGRRPLTQKESAALDHRGFRRLTLG